MILGRLFKRLFELGVVVVATSNVPPGELYKDGLNRALFLPFIALIEQHMEVVRLRARTDFRLEKLAGAPVWYVPADRAADAALDEAWRRLTAGHDGEAQDLAVKGRTVRVPRASHGRGAVLVPRSVRAAARRRRLSQDRARISYASCSITFRSWTTTRRNEAKRFIILIDTLYDNAVKLVASAAAEPDALYRAERGLRGARVQAHRLAPDRDALAGLSGVAARPRPSGRRRGRAEGLVET